MELALHDPRIPPIWALGERRIKHYSNLHQILLVGEGDFSFSAALANAFGSARNMVATSLDSGEKVLVRYPSAHMTLQILQKLGATVLHEVDVATMNVVRIINERLYHRIVYNFPHAGFWGSEVDKAVIKRHRRLVKTFFRNARTMLSRMGEIHVSHKEKHPYSKWKLEKQAGKCGLSLKEAVKFNPKDYPGYVNRRGEGERMEETFPLGSCRTYKFILCPSFFDTLHLLPMRPKLPWSVAENNPCVPISVLRNAFVLGGGLWASANRRYEAYEEEDILCRRAVRQRTEECYSLWRGNHSSSMCSGAASAAVEYNGCYSIQRNSLLMDGSLRTSVKRRYEVYEEEEILWRSAVRQRTEECHWVSSRGNNNSMYAAVGMSMSYFEARYPGKMSLVNMIPPAHAHPRLPSIIAANRNQPATGSSFAGRMNGLGLGFGFL